ncbi:hypothetical protein PG994_004333 [Apiospora phragmitis]|uniref:Uncharacterized protein n=1 Tax=Apiospora phragmitis TaxID=2905665 RepID=A0ABR1VQA9_9PEZI
MASANYDRWLKDAAPWAQEGDWDTDEYFRWVKRLGEAKAQLDDTYLRLDKSLLATGTKMAAVHKANIEKAGKHSQIIPATVAKLILRYIIAYNFFVRATYEETPDNALVGRVLQHLALLKIGVLDVDVASMLQCAADKCGQGQGRRALGKVQGERPHRERVHQLHPQPGCDGTGHPAASCNRREEDPAWKTLTQAIDTKEELDMFLARRAEPQLESQARDNDNFQGFELMVSSGDLDKLLATAEAWEKEHCSWEATIGPAIKVLRRLGRTSSGKEYKIVLLSNATHYATSTY